MFYSQYSGVVPDIQIMAKGIAGGLPLSAIVAKNYVMKGQKPGSMGGTYCESGLSNGLRRGRTMVLTVIDDPSQPEMHWLVLPVWLSSRPLRRRTSWITSTLGELSIRLCYMFHAGTKADSRIYFPDRSNSSLLCMKFRNRRLPLT